MWDSPEGMDCFKVIESEVRFFSHSFCQPTASGFLCRFHVKNRYDHTRWPLSTAELLHLCTVIKFLMKDEHLCEYMYPIQAPCLTLHSALQLECQWISWFQMQIVNKLDCYQRETTSIQGIRNSKAWIFNVRRHQSTNNLSLSKDITPRLRNFSRW